MAVVLFLSAEEKDQALFVIVPRCRYAALGYPAVPVLQTAAPVSFIIYTCSSFNQRANATMHKLNA